MFVAAPAEAACRLALVLALDISSSVDSEEDRLQRQGLAAALRDPEVIAAFLAGEDRVALMVYEWSGRYNQARLLDWTMIETAQDLASASDTIAGSPRSHNDFPTAMGYAIGFAATLFREGPECYFRTIDVSGDGENNDGFPPRLAYEAFDLAEVTVNGLVVNGGEYEAETNLIDYYETEVIRGPNAFIEVVDGFDDFQRAMTRKLIRELSAQILGSNRLGPDRPRG